MTPVCNDCGSKDLHVDDVGMHCPHGHVMTWEELNHPQKVRVS